VSALVNLGSSSSCILQVALGPKMRCKCYNSDLDVFENLRHMQKHRVGSAFHDLGRWCVDKSIPVSTMQQYFLPLATAHLCNDQYIGEKYQGLINAVIELVGAVCSQLTWPKYEPILKHFLNMMTRKPVYQRQLIRVVVAIVDAFHFDLSRVDLKKVQLHKTLVQEKESNPALGEMVDLEDLDQLAQPVAPVESAAVLLAAGEPIAAAKADKIYRSLTQFMIPGLSKLITDKVNMHFV
jgi:U3 small nucleolar RNA-associated protein 20